MANIGQAFLIRYGEIALKGQNRSEFESALERHIRFALRDMEGSSTWKAHGRFYVEGVPEERSAEAIERLSKLPGVVSVSPALKAENRIQDIKEACIRAVSAAAGNLREGMVTGEVVTGARDELTVRRKPTFKIDARRSDKRFPLTSPELNQELGAAVLRAVRGIAVDVHNPDIWLKVEVRDVGTFVYWQEVPGPGGLPLGVSGKGILLLSGGIDSPVAGYLAIKRGVSIDALHFWSFPITGERARDKVVDICKILRNYNPFLNLYIAPFTKIQTAILEKCPERFRVTVMRRMMMRVASRLAEKRRALAIFTGENLGQVASQTLESLRVIEDASTYPVIRPLICFDKQETIKLAKEIGTYETSCLPYEDCCTVFVPKHPVTKPRLEQVLEAEKDLDIPGLVAECVDGIEKFPLDED